MSPRERPPGDPGTAPDKRAKDAEEGPSELLPEAKQSLTQSLTVTAGNSSKEIEVAHPAEEILWSNLQ